MLNLDTPVLVSLKWWNSFLCPSSSPIFHLTTCALSSLNVFVAVCGKRKQSQKYLPYQIAFQLRR